MSKRPTLVRLSPEGKGGAQKHQGPVQAACVDPQGQWAISGGKDGALRVWDAERGENQDWWHAHDGGVWALTSFEEKKIVSAGHDHVLRVWKGPRSSCLATLKGHDAFVYRVTALPGGLLASGGQDRVIRLWDVDKKKCMATLSGHSRLVSAIVPVGLKHVLSASADGSLRLWDLDTQQAVRTYLGHRSDVLAVVVLFAAAQAVSSSADGELRLWDLKSGECLAHMGGHQQSVECVARPPKGWVISGGWDGKLRWWKEGLKAKKQLKVHQGAVRALDFAPAQPLLYTGGTDTVVRALEASNGKLVSCWEGPSAVTTLAALPRGRVLAGFSCGTAAVLALQTPLKKTAVKRAIKRAPK
ncbi:MAG: WD40 repeat domain-containing protein [Myxococcaceae bacterium]